ncbi:MAG: MFS family permease [Patiriisocius sp.]
MSNQKDSQHRFAKITLLASVMAMGFSQTILFAVLAPLGREIGLSEIQVGAIISASSLTVFIAMPIWGRVSDTWGRRKVILIGLFGYSIGTVLFASVFQAALMGFFIPTTAFICLTIARVTNAAVMAATQPASTAYMADITSIGTRTKGMGQIGAANNLGAILGPAIGGVLAAYTLLTPIWFSAAVTLIAAIAVMMVLPPVPGQVMKTKPPRLKFTDRRILPFVFVGIFMFMGFAIVQQTMAFRFQDILSLTAVETAQVVGIGMMLSAFFSLVAQMVVLPRLKVQPFTLLKIAMPILMGAFLMMAMGDTRLVLTTAMAIQGFGMGLAGPGFMSGASLAVSQEEQGSVAGVANSCGPLGFTIGPLLGTFLYSIQPDYPYWFTCAVYVPLMLFTLTFRSARS